MTGCILVPVKGFSAKVGKTRLAGTLTPDERAGLVIRMAERVVRTAAAVAPVFLISLEPPPPSIARHLHAVLADAGGGLNAELEGAVDTLMAAGHERVLILPGDVPLVATDDLSRALAQLHGCDMVLAPSHDGGTCLVGLRAPRRCSLCFEAPDSYEAHRAHAHRSGLCVEALKGTGLLLDVDTADDVAAFDRS